LLLLLVTLTGCGGGPPSSEGGIEDPFGGKIPVLHDLPDFSLVRDDGSSLTKKDLLGKVWLASFLFTSCPDVCPAMVGKIQMLQQTLPEGTLQVSVTVDPDRDRPDALARYAKFNHRIPGKWILATGEWQAISDLALKGFYLGGGERKLHSPRFALVDRLGRLRGYYDSRSGNEMTKVLKDVAEVLAEPDPSPPVPPPAPGRTP
jgi:protein SCO1/2